MPTTTDNPFGAPQRRVRFPRAKAPWIAIAVVVALGLAGGAATLADFDEPAPPAASGDEDAPAVIPSATPEADASLGPTVFNDPGAFEGQPLELWAKVVEVVDLNSFRVVNEDEPESSLLVVHAGDPSIVVGTKMTIKGVVTPFINLEVNEQLGIAITESTYEASDDEFALVAEKITIEGERGTEVAEESAAATSVPSAPVPVAAAPPVTTAASSGSASSAPPPATGSGSGGEQGGTGSSSAGSEGNGSGGSTSSGSGSGSAERSRIAYTGDETSGQYGDQAAFEATLEDPDGKPLEGQKVTFTLNPGESSRKFRAVTDREGKATAYEELSEAPGRYRLVTRYKQDDGRKVSDKTTFVIEKEDSAVELTAERGSDNEQSEENGNDNSGSTLTAFLTDLDMSYPIAGRTVEFFADGEFLGSAATDEDGVATFETEPRYNKHSTFEVRFAGDDYYLDSADAS